VKSNFDVQTIVYDFHSALFVPLGIKKNRLENSFLSRVIELLEACALN
jgi:hypothetical protein